MKPDRPYRIGGAVGYVLAGIAWVIVIYATGLDDYRFTQPQAFAVFAVPALAIGSALGQAITWWLRKRHGP